MKSSNVRIEICIDAINIQRITDFWCLALNYRPGNYGDETYVNLVPDGLQNGPVIFLQKVNEKKSIKNRIHIDIYSSEADDLIGRLLKNGGTLSGDKFYDKSFWWQVMQDPEGNELCIMPETDITKPNLSNII